MHITKVELEDIKSHRKFSQEFHRGTTAITGANGAGKTTILEAIAWTLFNLLDYKKDDFLRRGAKRGTARVTFESHLDGRRYTVVRDTGTKYQVYDNELKTTIADKRNEVDRFLQQHLGVEPGTNLETLFRSAIGVPQGTLTADFLRTAGERKPKFDKLLKVEEYREGAEKLRETARFVENRLQDVRTKIAVAENELSRLEVVENERRETAEKVSEFEKIAADLRGTIEAKTKIVADLERAETLVRETQKSKDKLEIQLEAARAAQIKIAAERDNAARAFERQKTLEADYRAHLAALDELKVLDAKQLERGQIQTEAGKNENRLIEARSDLKRLEENLQKAIDARRLTEELQPKIKAQTALEDERERARTARAEAEQARKQADRLETEIVERRNAYKEFADKIKDAELGAEAETRLARLEVERREVEAKLKDALQAETSLNLLRPRRVQLQAEIEKLQKSLAQSEKEASDFDRVLRLAKEAEVLSRKENTLVAEIAGLRAKIEHDEKFRGEVRNGLCPILSAKCLNIREGETLETHFQNELSSSYSKLETLTMEHQTVTANLDSARQAERSFARLEGLRSQTEQSRSDFARRQTDLQQVEADIRAFNGFEPRTLQNLRERRAGIEREIADLNEAARKYAEVQGLKTGLNKIRDEGKNLVNEQTRLKDIAARLPEIERQFADIERNLNELQNPRERAAGLRLEAEREAIWRERIETTKRGLTELETAHRIFGEKLAAFASLDADLQKARQTRDQTTQSYQSFLANLALAESLPVREKELAKAVEETARLEKDFQTVSDEYDRARQNYDHERHFTEKAALLNAQRSEAETSAKLDEARGRETSLRKEIERLSEIRKQMQTEFQEKYKLERVAETTEFIRDTLKKAAPEVAKSYLFSISKEANEIFREISGSAEQTLRWSEDYEIMLEEMGHERPFINLSGGEQMAAALSVRLALLKQLSDVRVAFFDEPTTNLDSQRRERLAQQIGQIRNFDQLFVISHDDTFEENVDYHIHVDGKASENSAE